MGTDTAHLYWNAEWRKPAEGSPWAVPEGEVLAHAARLPAGARILDLGAGIGRHALAFARAGFRVEALDMAEDSVRAIRAAADMEGLEVGLHLGPMTRLPFEDAVFDHVLSWNVIYHGDGGVVRRTLSEVARVLRPGGTLLATMLSARRLPVERAKAPGRQIAPGTWVFEGEGDKVHPHFFCNARELLGLLDGFEVLYLADREHGTPGSWHWHFLAEHL